MEERAMRTTIAGKRIPTGREWRQVNVDGERVRYRFDGTFAHLEDCDGETLRVRCSDIGDARELAVDWAMGDL